MANIGTTDIRDAAITTPKLARGSVTADKLAADARGGSVNVRWGEIGGLMEQQIDLNAALSSAISTSGSYDNPAWLNSLDAAKLTGTISPAVIGTGTADADHYLNGAGAWSPLGLSGTYTFDAATPGSVASMTFTKGILTGVTTL